MWEDRRLREIAEADIQQLVNAGLEEHLQLEYKSALYEGNDRGNKECLLDICMFANAGGGILLIGINEQRDANGQPTGTPDLNAELGVELPNPEQLLQAYDARVVSGIQERLPLELYPIPVANNRHVVAIRVPNSMSKPHRVQYQGHVYFPSRRERQRYEMDVREIKEMVLRTASRLEEAERKLERAIALERRPNDLPSASLMIGCIPVFWQNFMIDIRKPEVLQTVSQFHLGHANLLQPAYNHDGLRRRIVGGNDNSYVQVHRDGMVFLFRTLALIGEAGNHSLRPTAVDIILRAFIQHCAVLYTAAAVTGPFLLSMFLYVNQNTWGLFPTVIPGAEEPGGRIDGPVGYPFPVVQADNLVEVDRVIRPLCDQTHQMFGRESSPYFDANGAWRR